MNRLLVKQDWQQVEHNSRPDLLFNYFPTDSGSADYISRLSRQLVHHLTNALINLNNIYDCLCRRQETHLYLKFLEGLMTLGSLPLKGFTSQLLVGCRLKHPFCIDLNIYPEL